MLKRSSKPKVTREPPPLIAYAAKVTRKGKYWLAEFPDCTGCQTFALSESELRWVAEEALAGWLEAHIAAGQVPPRPTTQPDPAGQAVPVERVLAEKLRHLWVGGLAPPKNDAAVELGRLGGLKGGKARAASLSNKKRSEIAKKAAKARWKRS